MNSDKIVIEIDRDIYRICMVCVAFLVLPIFFLIILPWTGALGSPMSIFVIWPIVVIVVLYCFSRWRREPIADADSVIDWPEPMFEE
ncbi:MAG: hypothetical protein ACFFD9_07475 [Candidatus Thorarchaeota archaeon]